MKETVSIIIPVYNVEKFVERCILSVVNQTYKKLEIILVNDGSKDNSAVICHNYEKQDKRIKVYDKENGGISSARNFGLAHANGKYIMFLDSDDMLTLNAVETLLNFIQKTKADMCIGKGITINESDNIKPELMKKSTLAKSFNKYEAIENALYELNFSMGATMKLYKRNVLNNISFPIGKTFEDLFTLYKVFLNCTKVVYIEFYVYYYVLRTGSIVSNLNPLNNIDFLEAASEIHKFVEEKYPKIIKSADYRVFAAAIELFVKYPKSNVNLTQKNLNNKKEMWKIIKTYRSEVLLSSKCQFKYRILALISYFGQTILRLFYKTFAKR